MSRTDKLDRNTARAADTWIVNGVPVAAKIRNALLPTAAQEIADQLADAQQDALIEEMTWLDNAFDRMAECEDELVTPFRRNTATLPIPTGVRPYVAPKRVQHVMPNRPIIASEGFVPRAGASRGKHHADLDTPVPSLMAMAKARQAALRAAGVA